MKLKNTPEGCHQVRRRGTGCVERRHSFYAAADGTDYTGHVAEELWAAIGQPYSIHQQRYPAYDPAKAAAEETVLVVQIGSKVVARIEVPVDISEDEAKRLALESEGARRVLNGSEAKKVIFVAGRVTPGRPPEPKVNIVV
ncbi:MAG: hypothetical protein U0694_21635 [Anaerolineae bacterium]